LGTLYEQSEGYDIPTTVIEEIKRIVGILDECYGNDRDTGNEDGGCVFLILGEDDIECLSEYKQIIEKYRLSEELAEFKDILCEQGNFKWYSELYILTEYGITIIYAKRNE
jgi:hypothetical protein